MPCTYNIPNTISTQFVLLCWVVITLESLLEPRGSPIFVAVASIAVGQSYPRELSSWGQHGAHLGLVGPRWAQCWPHEPCYQGMITPVQLMLQWKLRVISIKCKPCDCFMGCNLHAHVKCIKCIRTRCRWITDLWISNCWMHILTVVIDLDRVRPLYIAVIHCNK